MGVDGRVVLLTGAERPFGSGVGEGLRAAGAVVVTLDDELRAGSREVLHAALTDLTAQHGGVDALVHAALPLLALEPVPTADVDDDRWRAVWEGALRSTLDLLAVVHPHLVAGGGGRVVVAVPPVGLSGVIGLCPLAATVEALRLLAKSTARQWGADRITVNTLVAAPSLFGLDPAATGTMSLAAPALGAVGEPAADLAPIVAFLTGDDAHFLTGATLVADGGVWTAL